MQIILSIFIRFKYAITTTIKSFSEYKHEEVHKKNIVHIKFYCFDRKYEQFFFTFFQVAGVSATTEQSSAPSVPQQGSSTLQLTDEPHMSIAAENAG